MPEHANLETGVTARLLAGANTGDSTATQQLIIHCCQRLETLARKMLRDFPRVKRWEDTADIFQNASMRLMRALEDVKPETTRHFYALAALQIRRELLDMARRYQGERGDAKSVTPLPMADHPKEVNRDSGFVDPIEPQRSLDRWSLFHETIAAMPTTNREVCELLWYQGLSQPETAQLLDIPLRTLKRRWQEIRIQIHDALGGEMP